MSLIYPRENEYRVKHDLIWPVKYFLRLLRFDNRNQKIFWFSATILKALILYAETTYAFQNIKEPSKLVIVIATYPVRIMAVWKLIYMYLDKPRVDYFYSTVGKDFWEFNIAGPALEKRIRRRFLITNVFVFSHVTLGVICVTLFALANLRQTPKGKRPLPNHIWAPFDTDLSLIHEVLYVLLLWNLYLTAIGNAFYDMVFVYCVQHLIAQFMLLKELINKISLGLMDDKSDLDRFNSGRFQKEVMDRLKICAEHHNKLLKYGKNIEDFCKLILAPQLIMSFAILVINGYNVSMEHEDFSKILMLVNLSVTCFIQLAVYALQATDLREESLSILDSVIECKWYLFRSPLKRALVFILMNAEEGIVINAAGMANVDKPLLVDIIQKVFSSITLLQAFIDGDDN